ncbi:MAG: tRNA preQ1(34) S-adenosylmethionine ribosyltransferase-isomerase QueA [Clostridia bacterium]
MLKSDFYYDLPPEQIAQTPLYPRDSSRMLYYNRESNKYEDKHFYDIVDILNKGDVLVVNNTRVLNARLFGFDEKGRKYEIFLLKRLDINRWECLLKPARKAKIGSTIVVNEELSLTIDEIIDNGVRIVTFLFNGVFEEILDKVAEVPLPPYITTKLEDKERYQTVYSKTTGSSAAPTAGLHFTPELIEKLKAKGIEIVEILLHVGLGTFRPVKEDVIEEHKMHSEYYEITDESADRINKAIKEGRRIIPVGTTSVRTLESNADENGFVKAGKGNTEIFIFPGYRFKVVKGLVTNFHLPESTLIMLVSALAGKEKVMELYKHAVDDKYRFFSFGDAMLIL